MPPLLTTTPAEQTLRESLGRLLGPGAARCTGEDQDTHVEAKIHGGEVRGARTRCTASAEVALVEDGLQPRCRRHVRMNQLLLAPPRENPLPWRFGLLGQPVYEKLDRNVRLELRLSRHADYLQHCLFHAYATKPPDVVDRDEVQAWSFFARAYDIESHYFTQHGHPFDDPDVHRRGLRHASVFLLHEHHRLASLGAFASFTLHPPDPDRMQLDEFAAEVGQLRDQARTEGLTATLRISNGGTLRHLIQASKPGGRHLWRLEDLLDFTKEQGVAPTIHLGFDHACRNPHRDMHENRDVDDWRAILREAPNALFVHGAVQYHRDTRLFMGFGMYDDLETGMPPIRPLLEALLEDGREATILSEGSGKDYDAGTAMVDAADLVGVDLDKAQQRRSLACDETHRHALAFG